MEDKYIGLILAVSGSVLIGSSFIITKKGLNNAASTAAYGVQASDNLSYFMNPVWWAGMSILVLGEIANSAAYTFAPPILITPLGASSVIIGAILASFVLDEELGHLGRLGCALCLIGSLIIVLHAPEDKPVNTVDEILNYAIQPGFLLYCLTVLVFTLVMIYIVVPKYGRSNPIVYISICSLVGSVSVMAIKGFGVAVKLSFQGNNQFTHPSTYVFGLVVALCILVQMNYFNKALDTFSTNVVNPMYYVGFSSCTIVSSLILFQGFNTTDAASTFSLLSGFIVTFLGVHLLNLSRMPEPPLPSGHSALESGLMNPRLSLQGRLSLDGWTGGDRGIDTHMSGGGAGGSTRGSRHGRQGSIYQSQTTHLFNAFEGPEGDVSLTPVSPRHHSSRQHPHRRQPSTDLYQVREADEWDDRNGNNDYDDDDNKDNDNNDDDDDDDERTALTKGKKMRKGSQLQSAQKNPVNPSPRNGVVGGGAGISREESQSPMVHANSSTSMDVRIAQRL